MEDSGDQAQQSNAELFQTMEDGAPDNQPQQLAAATTTTGTQLVSQNPSLTLPSPTQLLSPNPSLTLPSPSSCQAIVPLSSLYPNAPETKPPFQTLSHPLLIAAHTSPARFTESLPVLDEIALEFFKSFPAGYRFCPSDEELIIYYLRPRVFNQVLPQNKIIELDLYKYNPEFLAEIYEDYGENEWYFFTPRDKKYRNGKRPNRAAGDGYWKATGADRPIRRALSGELIGYRKALVFYKGKAPKGDKTNWIMHEYRVNNPPPRRPKNNGINTSDHNNMRLDDSVLCRIYKKSGKPNLRARVNRVGRADMLLNNEDHDMDDNGMSGGANDMDDYGSSDSPGFHTFSDCAYQFPILEEHGFQFENGHDQLHMGVGVFTNDGASFMVPNPTIQMNNTSGRYVKDSFFSSGTPHQDGWIYQSYPNVEYQQFDYNVSNMVSEENITTKNPAIPPNNPGTSRNHESNSFKYLSFQPHHHPQLEQKFSFEASHRQQVDRNGCSNMVSMQNNVSSNPPPPHVPQASSSRSLNVFSNPQPPPPPPPQVHHASSCRSIKSTDINPPLK